MNIKKELVEDFIEKLINHINAKSSEASDLINSGDSCFGITGVGTELDLKYSIRELFRINNKEENK